MSNFKHRYTFIWCNILNILIALFACDSFAWNLNDRQMIRLFYICVGFMIELLLKMMTIFNRRAKIIRFKLKKNIYGNVHISNGEFLKIFFNQISLIDKSSNSLLAQGIDLKSIALSKFSDQSNVQSVQRLYDAMYDEYERYQWRFIVYSFEWMNTE